MHLSVEELLYYTDEERTRWEKWFREYGEDLLRMPISGDRDTTIGALILLLIIRLVRGGGGWRWSWGGWRRRW